MHFWLMVDRTLVTTDWRSHSVWKKNADRRGAHCRVASNVVYALCYRIKCHAEAIILNMLKYNAAA